jgi:hypothetical protein
MSTLSLKLAPPALAIARKARRVDAKAGLGEGHWNRATPVASPFTFTS